MELCALGGTTGRSQSESIREALRRYVSAEPRKIEPPAPIGPGEFRSTRSDIGRRAEELLRGAANGPKRKR